TVFVRLRREQPGDVRPGRAGTFRDLPVRPPGPAHPHNRPGQLRVRPYVRPDGTPPRRDRPTWILARLRICLSRSSAVRVGRHFGCPVPVHPAPTCVADDRSEREPVAEELRSAGTTGECGGSSRTDVRL